MPKKKSSSRSALKTEGEPPADPTDASEPTLPPPPSTDLALGGRDVVLTGKLERRCAVAQIKAERRALTTLGREYNESVRQLRVHHDKAEKALEVLKRPRPPRIRLPPHKELAEICKWERRGDKAAAKASAAHVAMLEQQHRVACAIIVSRDCQIARLRRLLRKFKVPVSAADE